MNNSAWLSVKQAGTEYRELILVLTSNQARLYQYPIREGTDCEPLG